MNGGIQQRNGSSPVHSVDTGNDDVGGRTNRERDRSNMLRKDMRSGTALIVSVLLHTAGILTALLIHLQDPPAADRVIELVIQREIRQDAVARNRGEARQKAQGRRQHRPQPLSIPTPPTASLPDILDQKPQDESVRDGIEIPSSPLDHDMTPEQAWAELGHLLEQHPEFREMVVREMIAGSGFTPDTMPKIDLYLEQMIGGRFDQSWLRSRAGIEHAFRSYDGVHGWRQNSNYGNQINVLGLLRFLIDLIEGEDE